MDDGRQETTVTNEQPITALAGGDAQLAIVWVHPRPRLTPLDGSVVTLGRSAGCTTDLLGPNVSRRHAELVPGVRGWLVRDLRSKNGTFVNGMPISEAPVCQQDILRVGDWLGVIAEVSRDRLEHPVGSICPGVMGGSALARSFSDLCTLAGSTLDVVLIGETGTGKEVFARALHDRSGRSGPLVAVNCAALPLEMAEGELFGYRKGAFTSAVRSNLGYLRAAQRGTLFLDEVIELDERVQAKLLRALETRQVTPLGEASAEPVDLRVVAAAQTPLDELVEAGRFRADLYARLNGAEITILPIRQRREEILCLFNRTLAEHCKGTALPLDVLAAERLCLDEWSLNVRGILQVAARTAVLHGRQPELLVQHLPPGLGERQNDQSGTHALAPAIFDRKHSRAAQRVVENERRNVEDLERLLQALAKLGGNVTAAAKSLSMSRQRAYRLLDQKTTLEAVQGAS